MEIDGRPARILVLGQAGSIHTQRWVRHFADGGWAVRWVSLPPIPADAAAEALPSLWRRTTLSLLAAVPRVRSVARRFRPDVTSALFVPNYGWLAAMSGIRPVAVSAWGSDILLGSTRSRLHRARLRYVLRLADHLFADAEILRGHMACLGADAGRITVVPLGVDDRWLAAPDREVARDNDTVTVLQDRWLEPLYRVDTFIDAAIRLAVERPGRYRFVVVGDGSLREGLVTRAERGGLGPHVRFLPRLSEDELRRQVGEADIYVSAASSDATSVSMLEAMAAGCLPIVTDLPANRDWIKPGVNGLLFPVGDSAELARRIAHAADDCRLRRTARQHNRRLILERARWADNMAVVEGVLMELIGRYRAGIPRR